MDFSWFFSIGQSKLGYLSLDVLVTENLSLPSKVTEYPVEDGDGDISDHITAGNEELTITGSIASGSAFGMEFGSKCYSKMIDAIDQLRTMHKERKVITIVTGLGKYEDMAFTNLTIDRNNSPQTGGQWLSINASLRKIRKVSLKQADLPPDNAAKTDGANGKTGGTERKSGKSGAPSYDPNKSVAVNGNNAYTSKFGGKGIAGPIPYTPPAPVP
jgi:hypothetical protein